MELTITLLAMSNKILIMLIAIPFINGFIGWITNVIALKMTFYPIELWGFKIGNVPIGWQGIIPMKAEKMARTSVQIMTEDLVRIDEQFEKLDPQDTADAMYEHTTAYGKETIDKSMAKEFPILWSSISQAGKELIFREANKELPMVTKHLMEDLNPIIADVLDLEEMTVKVFEEDKELLNRTFLEVGDKEFRFIERSGFYFGFLFGIAQAALWYFTTQAGKDFWWILPVGGLVVGFMTNFLAIKLIFNPVNPIKIFGMTIQGMYIKRQKEISEAYADIVTKEVVTTDNMFGVIFEGEKSDLVMEMGKKHVQSAVDRGLRYLDVVDRLKRAAHDIPGLRNIKTIQRNLDSATEKIEKIRTKLVDEFANFLPQGFKKIFPFITVQLDLRETIRTRMAALPPDRFAGFLRPVFQEDEWKLIVTGAALGFVAGLLQMLMVNL